MTYMLTYLGVSILIDACDLLWYVSQNSLVSECVDMWSRYSKTMKDSGGYIATHYPTIWLL